MTGQKSVVVTGHASGMGQATAARFLDEGWNVVGLDLAASPPKALAGRSGFAHASVDVTALDQVVAAIDAALGDRALHTIVTAAGIYPPTTIATTTAEIYRNVFDVNVLGTMLTIQAALPYLRRADGGRNIVTFASADAFVNSPGQLVYSASKAAVVSLTRSLAVELAADGFTVNGVAPGWVRTAGTEANSRLQEAVASIPLGRAAEPEEIADWVWTLGSGKSTYLTGETLLVSGGAALR